jgi:hypothetical protein
MLQLHFAEFLKTGALVLPIQIERHWRDNAASFYGLRVGAQDYAR